MSREQNAPALVLELLRRIHRPANPPVREGWTPPEPVAWVEHDPGEDLLDRLTRERYSCM